MPTITPNVSVLPYREAKKVSLIITINVSLILVFAYNAIIYRFILAVKYFHKNAPKFLSQKIFSQMNHVDKRKVWHGNTFTNIIFIKKQKRKICEIFHCQNKSVYGIFSHTPTHTHTHTQ